MTRQIKIKKKPAVKGEGEYQIISIRIHNEMAERITELSVQANRSRNDVINHLLKAALEQEIIIE